MLKLLKSTTKLSKDWLVKLNLFLKRILPLFIFVFCLSIGDHSFAAGNSGKSEIAFSQGLLAYKNKNYSEARSDFSKALELNPQNTTAAHFLGLTYFDQNQYQTALPYFEKAVSGDSKDAEPHFYMALCLYRLGRSEEALTHFKTTESLASKDTPIDDLARSYRRSLEKKAGIEELTSVGQPRPWFAAMNFSTSFDTNVSLSPDNVTLASLPSDKNDFQFVFQPSGGYYFIQKNKYRLLSEVSYYQSIYPDLNDYNYGLAHVEVRSEASWQKRSLITPVFYDFSILQTSKYLQSVGSSPLFRQSLGQYFLLQLNEKIRFDDFFQTITNDAQNRDAVNLQTEPTVFFFFNQRKSYVRVGYNFDVNLAKGADWDVETHTLLAGFYSQLPWNLRFNAYGNLTLSKQFQNTDSVLAVQREDKAQTVGTSLAREMLPGFTVTTQYVFYRNTSNVAFYTNKRHVAGVNFAYRY